MTALEVEVEEVEEVEEVFDQVRLSDYASNTYSQFGEDGCIARILEMIGVRQELAVEFGAGDGLSCSNTARLWHDNWRALLIEADPERFTQLTTNAAAFPNVVCRQALITPEGSDSITSHLADTQLGIPDVMSIDIDGDDYFILKHLGCRPRLLLVEFNPTIPPHIAMRQSELGAGFGASLLELIRTAREIDYVFVGATYCNAFFVDKEDAVKFIDFETDPTVLFPPTNYTYAVTDYLGRLVLVGQVPPWGAKDPLVELVEASTYVTAATTDPEYIRRGFERLHGPAIWMDAAGLPPAKLQSMLAMQGPPLVCVDLTRATLSPTEWMDIGRDATHYRTLQVGAVLGFIRKA